MFPVPIPKCWHPYKNLESCCVSNGLHVAHHIGKYCRNHWRADKSPGRSTHRNHVSPVSPHRIPPVHGFHLFLNCSLKVVHLAASTLLYHGQSCNGICSVSRFLPSWYCRNATSMESAGGFKRFLRRQYQDFRTRPK